MSRKMLLGLFRSITLFSNKHPYLKYNSLVQNIFPYYQRAKVAIASLGFKPDLQFIADSVRFFSKNADRVRKVADFLADDRSKIAYLGNIKYRQTFNKQDFPSVGYDSVPYFIKEMNLSSAEVFIDCGACSGETTWDFIRRARGFDKIVIFEPEPVNYEECKKRLKIMKLDNNPNVQLLNTGAYDADGTIYFNTKGGGRGTGTIFAGGGESADSLPVNEEDIISVKVQTIDGLDLEKVTFIKMDIEGAELHALKGAEATILKHKPKLAICIYHSNEDMISIAEYIHNLVPEYKFYVRQNVKYPHYGEVALYAIMP